MKAGDGKDDLRMQTLLEANKRMQHQEAEIRSGDVTGSVPDAGNKEVHSYLGSEFRSHHPHRNAMGHPPYGSRCPSAMCPSGCPDFGKLPASSPQSRVGADDKVFAGIIHQVSTAMNEYEDMSFRVVQPKKRNCRQVVALLRRRTGTCYVVERHISLH